MNVRLSLFLTVIGLLFSRLLSGQAACTAIGQTPSTAFPVCGTSVFEQKEVPECGANSLFVPGCTGTGNALYANKNPYWYKFTCFESGSLGFIIKPKDATDDYDWQLYDITGLDPDEVYTNKNIIVSGNWAGNPGNTGTSMSGAPYIQCASSYDGNEPRFARMPNVIEGHEYLLLVSHYSDSQSGYDLSFEGGSAVITDPKQPDLLSLSNTCDAATIYIKTNKPIKCSSISVDGSDFFIPGSGVQVITAQPVCDGFDTDSLILKLDNPLPPGTYNVTVREGTDGNTLIDNCGNFIPEGNSLPIEIIPLQPTAMDSMVPVQCAPGELKLIFKKRINCNSVRPDGSDFRVTGPVPVTITGAQMDCDNDGLSNTITVLLSTPLTNGGTYTLSLKNGTDGNAIIDECGQETPVNSFIQFTIKDTVSAAFDFNLTQDCSKSDIQFFHDGDHGVTSWDWSLDYNGPSKLQNPRTIFPPFGDKTIRLIVSNGFCTDSTTRIVSLGAELKAIFETDHIICPEDSLNIINSSTGNITSYLWTFGDGSSSEDISPVHKTYQQLFSDRNYKITLTVTTALGCTDATSAEVKVLMSCKIDVPNAFTPNGDGINDYLYPLNAIKASGLVFRIYNRYGQLLFESNDWQSKWDGTFKGEPQEAAVYAWTLQYTNSDTGEKVFKKGSTVLIR